MRQKRITVLVLKSLALAVIIGVGFYFADLVRENDVAQRLVLDYGYVGIFSLAIITGFNIIVPIPAVAFLPLFVEAGLSFWLSITIIAIGTTIADSIAFFVGHVGRHAVHHFSDEKVTERVARLERIREHYPWAPFIILFIFASLAPFPNEVLLIPFGFLGYRLRNLIPIVFVGNFIFNTLYANGLYRLFEATV